MRYDDGPRSSQTCMNRGFSRVGLVPIISFLILSSLISPIENGQLEGNESRMEQFGGGSGSIEERCGSIHLKTCSPTIMRFSISR